MAAGFPTGIYLVADPTDQTTVDFLNSTTYKEVLGNQSCSTTCEGGVTGMYLKVPWNDFQKTRTSMGMTYLKQDLNQDLSALLRQISNIEGAIGNSFQMSIGLEAGDNAAFDVLDMYQATNGTPDGMPPNLSAGFIVPANQLENSPHCNFGYDSNNNINGHGGTFDTSAFPEQCTLRMESGATAAQCIQQARIWGNDAASAISNTYYVKAYTEAVLDLANFVSSSAGPFPHDFQALKLTGINKHDVEIGIAGNPGLLMPTPYYCGITSAMNAERIWTVQATGTVDIYDSLVMENTWMAIFQKLVMIRPAISENKPDYMIDVLGTNEFPPVQPHHCTQSTGTLCSYTSASSSLIGTLTTGEMDYLIRLTLDVANQYHVDQYHLAIQTQNLDYNIPNSTDGSYASAAIPCAMSATKFTRVGYQSGVTNIAHGDSGQSKVNYLASLTNAVTYGAQYIELFPKDLQAFIDDLDGITFNGIPSYGTSSTQNIDMLARTIGGIGTGGVLDGLVSNTMSSGSAGACPKPAVGHFIVY